MRAGPGGAGRRRAGAAARQALDLLPGVVMLPLARPLAPARMTQAIASRPPVFAREISVGTAPLPLPERDRITPIVAAARALGVQCGALWLEYPDTNDGKHLSAMCRRLEPLLRNALQDGAGADRRRKPATAA